MKKALVIFFIAGLIAAGFWFRTRQAVAEDEAVSPAARVETTPLADEAIVRTIEAFGVVAATPSGEQVVTAPYDCLVRQVHVSAGSTVAAGDVLVELDPTPDAKLAADSA